MKLKNVFEWAHGLFGSCDLGDSRRVNRLVSYAALQMEDPLGSTSMVCEGKPGAALGAYRFLRNPKFCSRDIDEGALSSVAGQCEERCFC